jgi:protein-S-isoprenylcysteine O-methyltransferase Ste14
MEARKMEKRESKVKDLVEKLQIGEITSKDGLKELGKRGLLESERWEIIPWAIYFILWLPLNFMFSDRLTRIHFPPIVIYISLAIGLLGILLCMGITRMHCKRGGLNHDETVILLKEGPYRVMRHPAGVGMMLPILLPIILSEYVPFSLLSVAAIITMIVYSYSACLLEEKKLDIPKWGDEYLQYMKEVPRFNFIKGLWNLRKRKQ